MIRRSILSYGAFTPMLGVAMLTSGPAGKRAEPAGSGAACTFAIRAANNMSFDVWVDLYESSVHNHANTLQAFATSQLKVQNHRIGTGKSMDARYEAGGSCDAKRTWSFWVRIGGSTNRKVVSRTTEGSGNRTVDLGTSSKWGL